MGSSHSVDNETKKISKSHYANHYNSDLELIEFLLQ